MKEPQFKEEVKQLYEFIANREYVVISTLPRGKAFQVVIPWDVWNGKRLNVLGHQQILDAVESIVADDFSADAEMRLAFYPEKMTEFEKIAAAKLGLIYTIVHSYNSQHSCYDVHTSWRRNALLVLAPDLPVKGEGRGR